MFDFPLIEGQTERKISKKQQNASLFEWGFHSMMKTSGDKKLRQTLTHQQITAFFYCFEANEQPTLSNESMQLVSRENLLNFALPKIIDTFFKESAI